MIRALPGAEAPVIGQFVAGGQQRSWLTCARFLRIAGGSHGTKEIVVFNVCDSNP